MNRQSNLIEQNTPIKVGMFNLQDGRTVGQLEAENRTKVRSVIACVDETRNVAIGLCPVRIMLPFSFSCLMVNTAGIESGREATRILLEEAAKCHIELPAAEFCFNFARNGVEKGEAFLPSKHELQKISLQGEFKKAWHQLGMLSGDRTFLSSSVGHNFNVWVRSFSNSATTGWKIQYCTFGVVPAVEIPF